jgi:hypothetical protein
MILQAKPEGAAACYLSSQADFLHAPLCASFRTIIRVTLFDAAAMKRFFKAA